MYKLNLNTDDKQLIDNYKLIKTRTKTTNKKGEKKEYITYSCSFPYSFIEMYNNTNEIYFYEYNNKTYITNIKPPNNYLNTKVILQCRKNSRQKSSKENQNKQWSKIMTIPKKIMGQMDNYNELNYVLHINQKDNINNKNALLEVYLT